MKRWDKELCSDFLEDVSDFLQKYDARAADHQDVSAWVEKRVKTILVRKSWHQRKGTTTYVETRVETVFNTYIYVSLNDGKLDMSSLKLGALYYGGIHLYEMGTKRRQKLERLVTMLGEAGFFESMETAR